MQLIDSLCRSQYYWFEESYDTANSDRTAYLSHSINFVYAIISCATHRSRPYRNLYKALESRVCELGEALEEDRVCSLVL